MLIRRRMEYHVRPILLKNRAHAHRIKRISDNNPIIHKVLLLPHLQIQLVERRLRLVEKEKLRRLKLRHLACNLAPNTPGSPSDKHNLAAQVRFNLLEIKMYRGAHKQIINIQTFQLPILQIPAKPSANVRAFEYQNLSPQTDRHDAIAVGLRNARRGHHKLINAAAPQHRVDPLEGIHRNIFHH